METDFYWGVIIWLSGAITSFTLSSLLTFIGLKRGWITIREDQDV